MKTKPFLILIALLLGCSAHSQNAPQPVEPPAAAPAAKPDALAEIAKLQEAYNTAMQANAGENAKWIEGLEKWYFAGLDKLQALRSKAGDLDGAVLVKAERDRVTMHTETTEEQIKAMPAALRTLRGTYEGSLKRIAEETGKKNLPVSRKFLADLEALQKRITVTGDIEQALIVKGAKEHFATQLAASATATTPVRGIGNPLPSQPAPAIPAAGGAQMPGNDQPLAEFLPGTKWLMYGRKDRVVEFHDEGKFVLDDWTQQGLAAEWKATGPNQVTVTITSGKFKNLTATLDFNETRSSFTGTDLDKTRKITRSPRLSGGALAEATTAPAGTGKNLFVNGNFEKGTDGWELDTFGKSGRMTVDKNELHKGKPTLRIDNTEGGLTFVRQHIEGKPNTHYQLSGYIMTKDVEPVKKGSKEGACVIVGFSAEVSVGQSQSKARGGKSVSIQKTKPWTKITVDFTSGSKTNLPVGAALGYYNENVIGTAWFAELSLVELGSNAKK